MEEDRSDQNPVAAPPPATSPSLDEAARLLGGVVTPRSAGGHEASGVLVGLPASYSEVLGHSLIVVQSPAVLRDVLAGIVARGDLGKLEVDGKLQVDVVPGDARYETMLLVDGAPSEAASGLLDEATRKWIRAARPGTFRIREEGAGTEVRVQLDQLDRASVAKVLNLVATFAAGLADRAWDEPVTEAATPAAKATEAATAAAPAPPPAPAPSEPAVMTVPEPAKVEVAMATAHHEPAAARVAHAVPEEDDGSAAAAVFLIVGFLVLVAALMGLLII
jgi:hypothetical protein